MRSRGLMHILISIAVGTLVLVGCDDRIRVSVERPTATPTPVATATPTPVATATPTPVPPAPTATLPPPTPTPALPKSGEWTATTEFGEFAFTVNPDGTGVVQIAFYFSEFRCGYGTFSGGVSVENPSSWPITGGQFTADIDLSPPEISIRGEFDKTGAQASGTWEIDSADSAGTICSGTWESR